MHRKSQVEEISDSKRYNNTDSENMCEKNCNSLLMAVRSVKNVPCQLSLALLISLKMADTSLCESNFVLKTQ
jgi:hypothetical protein